MSSIKPRIKENSNLPFLSSVFLILLSLASLILAIIYFSTSFFFKSNVDVFYSENRAFNMLLSVNNGDDNKFMAMAVVNPASRRAGLISFFEGTALDSSGPTLAEMFNTEDSANVAELLSEILGYNENFYLDLQLEDIVKYVDLIEGLPYFLWSRDKLEEESLPVGEFYLDGALAVEYLSAPAIESSPTDVKLFRQYSFLLNAWENRLQKWNFISNRKIFKKLVESIKSNLSVNDVYLITRNFYTDENWELYFMEVPVRRGKGRYVLDQEATALYLKKFKEKINSKKPKIEQARMDIQNGAGIDNLAKKMRYTLTKKGIQVLEFTNADHSNYDKSILINTSATPHFAQNVSKLLGVDRVYYSINKSMFTDMVLILGEDYKALKVND
jgi:hypothetical protein